MEREEESRPFYIPAWYYGGPDERSARPDNTFVRGEGMFVVREDGTRFEDWEGQSLVNNLGLGRADMAKVLADQVHRLSWLKPSAFSDVRVALTRDLQSILPHGISIPFYGIGGADSVEAAIRAARMVTGRKNVLVFRTGFHGDTITTEAVSGWGLPDYGDPRPWVVHVPSPYDCFQDLGEWDQAYERCLEGIEKALKKRGPRTFACVLVEPVMGVGGVVPLSTGLSKALREICDRHGTKLVADEVVTGFGRTGEWFGSSSVGLKPDAIVLAKGMTGGYAPLSAVVFERSWGEELRQNGFPHGPTFGGHLLGCAAARETIRILTVERLVERARTVGAYMKKRLSELGQQHPAVARDVRGMGLLLAIELRPARSTTQSTSAEKIGQRAQTVRAHMARRLKELRREPRGLVREVLGAGRLLARQLRAGGEGRTYGGHPASQRTWAISEGLLNDRIRVWVSGDASSIMFCPPFIVTESQVDRLVDRLDFHLRQISREDAGPTATRTPSAV